MKAYDKFIHLLKENFQGSFNFDIKTANLLKHELNEPNAKVIHLAGTNAKGSTANILSKILIESGYNVGLFTSPEIEKHNERIKINMIKISDDKLFEYSRKLDNICKKLKLKINEFTFFTFIAYMFFADNDLDFLIIETGLGGKKDPSNIFDNAILYIVTTIDYDHMYILGNNLKEISYEKFGIIKNDSDIILYYPQDEIFKYLNEYTSNNKIYYNKFKSNITARDSDYLTFDIKSNLFNYENLKINMIADYQINNVNTVLTAIESLRKNYEIKDKNIKNALKKSQVEGRMEYLKIANKGIILDVSHNTQGANALKNSLETNFPDKKLVFLLAMLSDKDYNGVASIFSKISDAFVLSTINDKRALNSLELKKILQKNNENIEIIIENNISDAFFKALGLIDKNSLLICTGSFYLINDIKKNIKTM